MPFVRFHWDVRLELFKIERKLWKNSKPTFFRSNSTDLNKKFSLVFALLSMDFHSRFRRYTPCRFNEALKVFLKLLVSLQFPLFAQKIYTAYSSVKHSPQCSSFPSNHACFWWTVSLAFRISLVSDLPSSFPSSGLAWSSLTNLSNLSGL